MLRTKGQLLRRVPPHAVARAAQPTTSPVTVATKALSRRAYLYWFIYRARMNLAAMQLRLISRCHRDLTNMLEVIYPQWPPADDPESAAAQEFAAWTPTAQTVFAVVAPNHTIRGPGEYRKLRP